MAKVILLNGSPHANGCTRTALDEMIRVFEDENIETELIHVGKFQTPSRSMVSRRWRVAVLQVFPMENSRI